MRAYFPGGLWEVSFFSRVPVKSVHLTGLVASESPPLTVVMVKVGGGAARGKWPQSPFDVAILLSAPSLSASIYSQS